MPRPAPDGGTLEGNEVMQTRLRFVRCVASFALALSIVSPLAAVASEGMTRFEIEFFQNGSSEPMNLATIWISDRRLRIEQRMPDAVEGSPVLVYRGDEDRVLSISDRDRHYAEIDRHMLRMLGMKSLGAEPTRSMRRSVDAQLKGLPEDQRAALERVLGISRADAVAAPLTVEHETERSEVAGIACRRVLMTRAEAPVGDACVADWDHMGITESDVQVFRALANFQRDVLGARGVTPLEFVPDQAFDLIVQFDGFPLSFRRLVDERERSAIRVRSVEHLAPDEGLFSVPSGYARRSGYGAFAAHLAPSDPARSRATEATAAPAQPVASPAPASPTPPRRQFPLLDRRRGMTYEPITLFPRDD